MAWSDQMSPASFRDVAFDVTDSDGDIGRRTVVHEYPMRDKPWVEDLGRKARTFALEAIVLGADYMAKRDRLLRALETPGPGALVHPYLGRMEVTLIACRMAESSAMGGSARFSLVFVEAGASTWPRAATATPDQVAAAAEPTMASSQAAFADGYSAAGQPDFVAASARSVLGGLLTQVRAAAANVQAALAPLAELQGQIDAINDDLVALVYEPAELANSVVAVVQQLVRGVAIAPLDALGLARTLWRFGSLASITSGVSSRRRVELGNQVELARLVRTAAITEGARAASQVAFDSFDAASALRDEMADVIDELLLATLDDDAFDTLRALRATVVNDISVRGADLVRLVRYTPVTMLPALLLAQMLYGDGTQAEELLTRNAQRVAHPLFVPSGSPLEVLANE